MFRNSHSCGLHDAELHRTVSTALFLALCLFLTACGGGGSSGGGGGGGTGGGGGGGYTEPEEGTLEPTLSSIQEHVFTPICTQCHTGSSAPHGLRLEAGMSFGMLVNVDSSQVPSLKRVEPGNPDDSYMIRKLEGTNSVGERMPFGGPYLSSSNIAVIRQWITDGAQGNKTSPSGKPRGEVAGELAVITMGWPVADSSLAEAPKKILLMADAELDTTLINANSVQLLKLDDSDDVDAARAVNGVSLQVTSLAPTVIRLGTSKETTLQPGRYAIRVKGSGASPLADRGGRLIDGDADGVAGGDFIARFEIKGAQ